MKFTVVTTAFNSGHTIEDTLSSVRDQTWQDIEHIIVDGGSTDNTLEIVAKYPHVSNVVSEPDDGIYFAMNKGIELATGDVILFLNSDDMYAHDKVIEQYDACFKSSGCDFVYSDLVYVEAENTEKAVRRWVSGAFSRDKFLNGWMPPHPTFALKADCFRQFGGFNTQFSSAADYEFMLRMAYKNRLNAAYVAGVSILMRQGGQSNASLNNRLVAHMEDRRAWAVNGMKPRFYSLVMKPLRKLGQFFVHERFEMARRETQLLDQESDKSS